MSLLLHYTYPKHVQAHNMQDFGFWLEQLQQHRLYQQHIQQDEGEAPSITQLSVKVTSTETSA